MSADANATLLVPDFLTVTIGMIVFFLGSLLTRRIDLLRNYNIPEPVTGGLAVALLVWLVVALFDVEVVFQTDTRDLLLVIFFAAVGLNARLADLVAGGRLLAILLGTTLGFLVLQNVLGVAGARLFGLPNQVGVLVGSASLIGGHGTAIAWGPTIRDLTGFAAASELAIAAATLGLVCAALVGGPIAKFLIDHNRLEPAGGAPIVGLPNDDSATAQEVNHVSLIRALLAINIAILGGYLLHQGISEAGVQLPLFVPCMLVAILMSNTVPLLFPRMPWPARTRALALVSDYSLSIFLAISLMSMQLWALAGLGGPLIGILAAQVVLTVLLVAFVFFRVAGADYTSAVLSAGLAGFVLGATPTAIANMSSVTKRYGPAPLAFIVLPLVSAFFVDLANAVVIGLFTAG